MVARTKWCNLRRPWTSRILSDPCFWIRRSDGPSSATASSADLYATEGFPSTPRTTGAGTALDHGSGAAERVHQDCHADASPRPPVGNTLGDKLEQKRAAALEASGSFGDPNCPAQDRNAGRRQCTQAVWWGWQAHRLSGRRQGARRRSVWLGVTWAVERSPRRSNWVCRLRAPNIAVHGCHWGQSSDPHAGVALGQCCPRASVEAPSFYQPGFHPGSLCTDLCFVQQMPSSSGLIWISARHARALLWFSFRPCPSCFFAWTLSSSAVHSAGFAYVTCPRLHFRHLGVKHVWSNCALLFGCTPSPCMPWRLRFAFSRMLPSPSLLRVSCQDVARRRCFSMCRVFRAPKRRIGGSGSPAGFLTPIVPSQPLLGFRPGPLWKVLRAEADVSHASVLLLLLSAFSSFLVPLGRAASAIIFLALLRAIWLQLPRRHTPLGRLVGLPCQGAPVHALRGFCCFAPSQAHRGPTSCCLRSSVRRCTYSTGLSWHAVFCLAACSSFADLSVFGQPEAGVASRAGSRRRAQCCLSLARPHPGACRSPLCTRGCFLLGIIGTASPS